MAKGDGPERISSATSDGVVFGLFPDRLILPSETIVGKELLEKTEKEIASRDGDFVPTIKLAERDLQAADLTGADLRGVSLNRATMRHAHLSYAQLEGANLSAVQLQGTYAQETRLQGANLRDAQLQGADLEQARLQGADLTFAKLQGALLDGAHLQGAGLSDAQLQGANLRGAQLQGANLSFAKLMGSELKAAQFVGANLIGAQLQGADLASADMLDAVFNETFVWRANFADADLSTAMIRSVHAEPVKLSPRNEVELLTLSDIGAVLAVATFGIAPPFTPHDDAQKPTWFGMEEASRALDPGAANYRRRLATVPRDLACGPDGAPYIARGLVSWPADSNIPARLASLGDQLDAVRSRMEEGRKNPEKCPGVVGFTETDWHSLRTIEPTEPALADHSVVP